MTIQAPVKTGSGMGVASLVLGIVAVIFALIPFVGIVAFFIGGVGLILGAIALFQKNRKKGVAIAGVILAVASFIIAGVVTSTTATAVSDAMNESGVSVDSQTSESKAGEEAAVADEKSDDVPTEYKTALKSAENYNSVTPLSKKGMLDQLSSEYGDKFSKKAAQYAVDNVDADWKENAVKSAKTYQETMSMSPSAIQDQLSSSAGDKYTKEEAAYAVKQLD